MTQVNDSSTKNGEFTDISEIRDIVASAHMGIWRIELIEGQEPRMYADKTMKTLLGIDGQERSPEKTYTDWYANIYPDAIPSVLHSVEKMQQGYYDENTYRWMHPTKGVRYVRCGGTSQTVQGGHILRGYHYDVDEVIRREQSRSNMLRQMEDKKNEYHAALLGIGSAFYSMHVLDLVADTVVEVRASNEVKYIVDHKYGASDMLRRVIAAFVLDEYRDVAFDFTDLSTLADRMRGQKVLTKELMGKHLGWFIAGFIAIETDEEDRPTKVILTTRSINEKKKQEELLLKKSHTDELTGILNRRAYEDDIFLHEDLPKAKNFVYVSIDVNGLKVINDTKGHSAGDELIVGACQCMNEVLGPHGKIYRVGGDEFVAILFCSVEQAKKIFAEFDSTVESWSGKTLDSLSVSYGWVSREEYPETSIKHLGEIADKRMYNAKAEYYRTKGVDRRGQQDAHKALCALYTKILRINVTDDTFQIINMDPAEMKAEDGMPPKISEWLHGFGETGHVHPDDLEEYLAKTDLEFLREYFAGDKTSLHVFYRRKYGDSYKQVLMEIIHASDYRDDNQSLFLYVKDIDR